MNKKPLTYEQAMDRLEAIVSGLENNTLPLDDLTDRLAEAQELIKFCGDKLQRVETDVNRLLNRQETPADHEQE